MRPAAGFVTAKLVPAGFFAFFRRCLPAGVVFFLVWPAPEPDLEIVENTAPVTPTTARTTASDSRDGNSPSRERLARLMTLH